MILHVVKGQIHTFGYTGKVFPTIHKLNDIDISLLLYI